MGAVSHFTGSDHNYIDPQHQIGSEHQHMQLVCVVIAALAVIVTRAVPAPQDVPDSSEVELIEPFNSGASDGEGKPVVVVVRPTSFGEVFAGFPGFGKFPGFHNFPRFSGADGVPRPHQVSLDDLFGGDHEEPLTPTSNNCGLLCKVFKTLEGSLGVFDDGEGGIRSTIKNNNGDEDSYDNHTVTYSEKVLPDGSVLRINKTVIHDTDENGNGFFFQSSVHHIFEDKDEEDEVIAGDVVVNDEEEPDMATVDEAIDDTIVDIIENPEKVTVLDTIDDPTLNEIDS